jgi:SAM-dependent methyltransferase
MSAAVLDDYYAWIECLIGWIDDRVLVVGDIFRLLRRGSHFVLDWNHRWHWDWIFGEILSLLFRTLL